MELCREQGRRDAREASISTTPRPPSSSSAPRLHHRRTRRPPLLLAPRHLPLGAGSADQRCGR
jgi:hypothetical protein